MVVLEGMKIRKDRSEILKHMTAPKIVLLGKEDPVLEYDSLKIQLQALEIYIKSFSGGHMSYIENELELTYKIKRFIEN